MDCAVVRTLSRHEWSLIGGALRDRSCVLFWVSTGSTGVWLRGRIVRAGGSWVELVETGPVCCLGSRQARPARGLALALCSLRGSLVELVETCSVCCSGSRRARPACGREPELCAVRGSLVELVETCSVCCSGSRRARPACGCGLGDSLVELVETSPVCCSGSRRGHVPCSGVIPGVRALD